jgi:hypothetical protein
LIFELTPRSRSRRSRTALTVRSVATALPRPPSPALLSAAPPIKISLHRPLVLLSSLGLSLVSPRGSTRRLEFQRAGDARGCDAQSRASVIFSPPRRAEAGRRTPAGGRPFRSWLGPTSRSSVCACDGGTCRGGAARVWAGERQRRLPRRSARHGDSERAAAACFCVQLTVICILPFVTPHVADCFY